MTRSIVVVRCVDYTPDVAQLADAVRGIFDCPIVFAPDGLTRPVPAAGKGPWPADAILRPIQATELDHLGLFYAREKIGWLCGDYPMYLASDLEWEYAWIVEPDVAFVGGVEGLLRELDASTADLLCTKFGTPTENWLPYGRLRALVSEIPVRSMSFPLERVSRRLMEACLDLRRSFTETLTTNEDLRVPNDESVVASVAGAGDFDVVDMVDRYPDVFTHWFTTLRFPLPDVHETVRTPKIIHSAVERGRFEYNVRFQWKRMLRGETTFEASLKESLSLALPETRARVLEACINDTEAYLAGETGAP